MPAQIAGLTAFGPPGRAIAEKRREDAARPLGALAARMAQCRVLHNAARGVALVPAAHVCGWFPPSKSDHRYYQASSARA